MPELKMDRDLKMRFREALLRLDDDVKEIEEIHKEMNDYLYDIEKRIAKMRGSKRDWFLFFFAFLTRPIMKMKPKEENGMSLIIGVVVCVILLSTYVSGKINEVDSKDLWDI